MTRDINREIRIFVKVYDGNIEFETDEEILQLPPPPWEWEYMIETIYNLFIDQNDCTPVQRVNFNQLYDARLFYQDHSGLVAELNARSVRNGIRENDHLILCLHGHKYNDRPLFSQSTCINRFTCTNNMNFHDRESPPLLEAYLTKYRNEHTLQNFLKRARHQITNKLVQHANEIELKDPSERVMLLESILRGDLPSIQRALDGSDFADDLKSKSVHSILRTAHPSDADKYRFCTQLPVTSSINLGAYKSEARECDNEEQHCTLFPLPNIWPRNTFSPDSAPFVPREAISTAPNFRNLMRPNLVSSQALSSTSERLIGGKSTALHVLREGTQNCSSCATNSGHREKDMELCGTFNRKQKIARWLRKREKRNWSNKLLYPLRHTIAKNRKRGENGRFVCKSELEEL